MSQYILGISAFYHDSAACLLRDGEIFAAAQEERFTRKKGDASFPRHAIEFCLRAGGVGIDNLSYVGFYDKPLLKFERILETYLGVAPRGFIQFLKAGPVWIKEKLFIDREIRNGLGGYEGEVLYAEHHESHAASAFFPSPFNEAAIVTMDGVGEWATAAWGVGNGNKIELVKEIRWPDSLGLLYSAFTYFAGFKVNSGEYKVMGLAPYGRPKYIDTIYRELIDLREDGSFRLNQKYFNYLTGLTMTSSAFQDLFDGPPREPETKLTQREMDLARSIQEVCEEVMLLLARHAKQVTASDHLVMAGGCALNCVANGVISRERVFKKLWIQPAAGDAGGALGAALATHYEILGNPRRVNPADAQHGSYLGPRHSNESVEQFLQSNRLPYRRCDDAELPNVVADLIASEKVIGVLHGRMEFGPRALGARSILGDARSPRMQTLMNVKIKFRESFRPFAPAVMEECSGDYFECEQESPYMLLVGPVRGAHRKPDAIEAAAGKNGIDLLHIQRSDVPAITHIDYSARVQTVTRERNGMFYEIIRAFNERTGCPVIINTSFNIRGEPIVNTPQEAYRCFMFTDMDALVLENCVLLKEEQPPMAGAEAYKKQFQLD